MSALTVPAHATASASDYEADGADARAHGYALGANPYLWNDPARGEELEANRIKREAWARGWSATPVQARAFIQCCHAGLTGSFLREENGALRSPIFADTLDLYRFIDANGWSKGAWPVHYGPGDAPVYMGDKVEGEPATLVFNYGAGRIAQSAEA